MPLPVKWSQGQFWYRSRLKPACKGLSFMALVGTHRSVSGLDTGMEYHGGLYFLFRVIYIWLITRKFAMLAFGRILGSSGGWHGIRKSLVFC